MTAVGIPKLKVRVKKMQPLPACALEMSALATCWASFSTDDRRCAETAKALTACMQSARPAAAKRSSINFHLARLGRQVLGR
ncbi:hypothetical protein H4R18_005839 [Coemansia javaensis]|uniref:CHCH domain-containing protein n=1 Tax=Coemansia javaensis TaxID=2761396 RepID=A0A9W8H407_9FUNG|nr:hypothetical protein H4R18_005839 [Coemansia javaensis]